jgi:hypothetical protein
MHIHLLAGKHYVVDYTIHTPVIASSCASFFSGSDVTASTVSRISSTRPMILDCTIPVRIAH